MTTVLAIGGAALLGAAICALWFGFKGRRAGGVSGAGHPTEEADTRSGEEQLSFLLSSFGDVLKLRDLDGILQWTAKASRELLDVPYAHAALLHGSHHGTAVAGDLESYPTWWHPKIQRLVLWASSGREVLRDGENVLGIEGFYAVPLVSAEGRGFGTVVVGGKALTDREERALGVLASRVAPVLEQAEEAPGGREPISALPNEFSLKTILARELSQESAVTLLVLRLDSPREYSRLYGPRDWSVLLGKVHAGLQKNFRRVFRQGDGLVVVLKGSDRSAARRNARRLQTTATMLTSGSAVALDVSVGFVTARAKEARGADALLNLAAGAASEAENQPEGIFGGYYGELLETLRRQISPSKEQTVAALVKAVEIRHPSLGAHMRSVSRLAVSVGYQMALPQSQLETLSTGGLLHDVGKIGIPDAILLKSGPLTIEEYATIKDHPGLGARILAEGELFPAIPTVKHHHERFDGTGYPAGLRGEDIPLAARIVSIADTFDNMTHDRPYRKGVSQRAALEEILRNSGTQFDPEVVASFAALLESSRDSKGLTN